MTYDEEIATLIQRYLKEEKNEELSIEEILSRPRWKRVWIWWLALEKYEGKKKSELTLEECKKIYGD